MRLRIKPRRDLVENSIFKRIKFHLINGNNIAVLRADGGILPTSWMLSMSTGPLPPYWMPGTRARNIKRIPRNAGCAQNRSSFAEHLSQRTIPYALWIKTQFMLAKLLDRS